MRDSEDRLYSYTQKTQGRWALYNGVEREGVATISTSILIPKKRMTADRPLHQDAEPVVLCVDVSDERQLSLEE